jgi:hypothetical protein
MAYNGKELICNGCGKPINLDGFASDWFSDWFDENGCTIDYCRKCAIKLPGRKGQYAKKYFEGSDLARSLSTKTE